MKGLSLKVRPDYAGGTDAFTEGRGRTVLREKSSSLTITTRTLVLADTCLGSARGSVHGRGRGQPVPPGRGAHPAGRPGTVTLDAEPRRGARPQRQARGAARRAAGADLDGDRPAAVAGAGGRVPRRVPAQVRSGGSARRSRSTTPTTPAGSRRSPHATGPMRRRPVVRRHSRTAPRRSSTWSAPSPAPVALVIIVTSMCGVPPWELPGLGWTRTRRDRVDVARASACPPGWSCSARRSGARRRPARRSA